MHSLVCVLDSFERTFASLSLLRYVASTRNAPACGGRSASFPRATSSFRGSYTQAVGRFITLWAALPKLAASDRIRTSCRTSGGVGDGL